MPAESKLYEVKTLSQMMDGPTEIDWVIPQLIPAGAAGVIAGDSGIGKSWLLMELSLSIATGTKFLGYFPVKQGPVLVVDEENAELLLRNRLSKMMKARGIKSTKLPIYYLVGNAVNFSPVRQRNGDEVPHPKFLRLLETIRKLSPAVTLFDSLIRVHRSNEKESSEIAGVFQYVRQLIDETNTTPIFSHHVRKASQGYTGNSGDRIRGSTDIRANAGFTILIDPQDKGMLITPDKARYDEKLPPFRVKFITDAGKTRFGLSYTGEVNSKKLSPAEWLKQYLKREKAKGESSAISRQIIVERCEAEGICKARKLDETLSEGFESGLFDKVRVGRDSRIWLNGASQ